MEKSLISCKFHAENSRRPFPVLRIIFISDFTISLLTPFLMGIFSYAGYLIDLVAIFVVIAASELLYSSFYASKGNREDKMPYFYVWEILVALPAMFISTISFLYFSGIITGIKSGATILLFIANIMFALSILFPFIRQHRIVAGKDRTLIKISEGSPELLKTRLRVAHCMEPLLYVKNLGGRKIANASQIGVTKPVIIMTDFLYENMTEWDLSAILGHEMGHFVNRDAIRSIVMFTIPNFLTIDFVLYAIITVKLIPIIIAAFFILYQLLDILIIFPRSRRVSEIRADRFVGMKLGMAEDMVSALETLIVMNGRPFQYRFFSSRTHPSIERRISFLRKYFSQGSETSQGN